MIKHRIELWRRNASTCQSFEDLVLLLHHLAHDKIYSQSSLIHIDLYVCRLEALATVLNIYTPVPMDDSANIVLNAELDTFWQITLFLISASVLFYPSQARMLTNNTAKPDFSQAY
jgi:hypothetical protein